MSDDKSISTAVARLALAGVAVVRVPGTERYVIQRTGCGDFWRIDSPAELVRMSEVLCTGCAPQIKPTFA